MATEERIIKHQQILGKTIELDISSMGAPITSHNLSMKTARKRVLWGLIAGVKRGNPIKEDSNNNKHQVEAASLSSIMITTEGTTAAQVVQLGVTT